MAFRDRITHMLDPRTEAEHAAVKVLRDLDGPSLSALTGMIERSRRQGEGDVACSRCGGWPDGPLTFAGRHGTSGELLFTCADCLEGDEPD
ncbi:hypothetical protein G1H11_03095 [Phytoactinopolyspora alkaliphila]|uniref:Uncharacterized protein n=1 Tax=Phytoactinopolyspora alkaliphila TaxID=1783498 RepID=A0A6N9YGW3_9ACTN|nr:hypothetical protein [Phytoactinopolyspora alkaliphila]NED94291.1 hypothetical protein [Phytoactinopolyspora alkaliphila]